MTTNFRSIIPDLKADCGKLVNSFVELNTTSFTEFIKLWKCHNIGYIFAGQGETEIDYFIFHIFHVAKGFCDTNKSKSVRVAGLYLLYLLYYLQPLKIKKSIRLVPEEFANLKALAESFKNTNKEVSFAFYKLILDNAFDFVATALPYDENLIHYWDELKEQGQSSQNDADKDDCKLVAETVFTQSGFNRHEWTKMVNEYNAFKKKINSCCSLNLNLTKAMSEF